MHKLKNTKNFSKPQLTIFILAFALIGFLIYKSFAAPNPNLPGDLNGDNTVNVTDLSILLTNYGTSSSTADVNSDGTVNVLDMSILLSNYGKSATVLTNCSTSSTNWQNISIASQTGTFTATYYIVPSAQGADAVTGFSNGPATDYTSLAPIIRFNTTNTIDARNGADYAAANNLGYTAGQQYLVKMDINITNHTYNAYITPQGGAQTQIASNYAFRTEQASVGTLSSMGFITTTSNFQVCSLQIANSVQSGEGGGTGTTRNATPSNVMSVIDGSADGDTVLLQSGSYSKITFDKSFGTTRLTITCASGVTVAGINTNGKSNYTIKNCTFSLPINGTDISVRPVENLGPSQNVTWQNIKATGGFNTFDVYGPSGSFAKNIVLIDSDISNTGGDLIHTNGVDGLRIEHNNIHDPYHDYSLGTNAEHHDGWQAQNTSNAQFLRNHIWWTANPGAYAGNYDPPGGPNVPGGYLGQGIIMSGDGSPATPNSNILVANNLIEHYNGRPMELNGTTNMQIVNNTLEDSGDGTGISIGTNMVNLQIWNNITMNIYNNTSTAPALVDNNWITGGSGGWEGNVLGTNYYTGSPGWADYSIYSLSVGGPAYTKGSTRSGTPGVDIDNTARPNPPALGARL